MLASAGARRWASSCASTGCRWSYDWELEPDGTPLRVRVLGEDLIAWRDSNGKPGFLAENCPHRGASLFFGRNEEVGLAVRVPRLEVRHRRRSAWTCRTSRPNQTFGTRCALARIAPRSMAGWCGCTWASARPRRPRSRASSGVDPCRPQQRQHSHKLVYECNWLQALEGELDTTHVYFLHSRLAARVCRPSTARGSTIAPRSCTSLNTPGGVLYGGKRVEEDGNTYWRTTQFLFPMYGMYPGGRDDGTVPLSIYVPDRRRAHAAHGRVLAPERRRWTPGETRVRARCRRSRACWPMASGR